MFQEKLIPLLISSYYGYEIEVEIHFLKDVAPVEGCCHESRRVTVHGKQKSLPDI
jgi:hypothetical protein